MVLGSQLSLILKWKCQRIPSLLGSGNPDYPIYSALLLVVCLAYVKHGVKARRINQSGWPQSRKLREFEKLPKSQGKCKICDMIANKNVFQRRFFSFELPEAKFENALETSGKTQGIQFLKNVATLVVDLTFLLAVVILIGLTVNLHPVRKIKK